MKFLLVVLFLDIILFGNVTKGFGSNTSCCSFSPRRQRLVLHIFKGLRPSSRNSDEEEVDAITSSKGSTNVRMQSPKPILSNVGNFLSLTGKKGMSSFEQLVRKLGYDDYEFDDFTRGALNETKKTLDILQKSNIHDIHELVVLLNYVWTQNLDYDQKKEVFVVTIYLGAILVLSYSFIAGIMSACLNVISFKILFSVLNGANVDVLEISKTLRSILILNLSGAVEADSYAFVLQFQSIRSRLDLFFGGPFLPIRVAATIPLFFQYQKWIRAVSARLPLLRKSRYPALNRAASIVLMWMFVNLGSYVSLSVGGFWLFSLQVGTQAALRTMVKDTVFFYENPMLVL